MLHNPTNNKTSNTRAHMKAVHPVRRYLICTRLVPSFTPNTSFRLVMSNSQLTSFAYACTCRVPPLITSFAITRVQVEGGYWKAVPYPSDSDALAPRYPGVECRLRDCLQQRWQAAQRLAHELEPAPRQHAPRALQEPGNVVSRQRGACAGSGWGERAGERVWGSGCGERVGAGSVNIETFTLENNRCYLNHLPMPATPRENTA